ncbi:hypothetical protein DPMN_055959 [Dreissena polymorpha]|uniref:Uncharacterized protein n=1 Tax=Dreissena polymorpha TaxID=45954 RepID=A0A9D4CTL0_DREPO|nr:hypothetical protein DPMN_055959 [Dreissena polymorpha]
MQVGSFSRNIMVIEKSHSPGFTATLNQTTYINASCLALLSSAQIRKSSAAQCKTMFSAISFLLIATLIGVASSQNRWDTSGIDINIFA